MSSHIEQIVDSKIVGMDLSHSAEWGDYQLTQLPNLTWLKLDGVANLKNLDNFVNMNKLERVSFYGNSVASIISNKDALKEGSNINKNNMFRTVRMLNLRKNKIICDEEFLSAFSMFESLETIDISNNELTELPHPLVNMRSLQCVNLSFNKLSNAFVLTFLVDSCKNLRFLDLSYNAFSFNTSNSLLSSASLSYLDLSGNSLKSSCEDLNKIEGDKFFIDAPNLTVLKLAKMNLTNIMFKQAFPVLSEKITEVELQGNLLENIPHSLYNLEQLQYLNLSHNSISYISDHIQLLTNLKILNLSFNHIGQVPIQVCKLEELTHLLLSANELDDESFEDGFFNFEKLKVLSLSFNQFVCFPFVKIGFVRRKSVSERISRTSFSGVYYKRSDIGMPNLSSLNLSNNHSLVTVPDSIYKLISRPGFVLNVKNNPNFTMPPKPVIVKDEFEGMDFSYENVKNMTITLFKQQMRLEKEEKARIALQKEQERIKISHQTNKKSLQMIKDAESKKKEKLETSQNQEKTNAPPSPPPPPPPTSSKKYYVHEQSNIDLTELFEDEIKNTPGLYKYQIENLNPAVCEDLKTFYSGDCYIFLNVEQADKKNDQFDYKIFVWIGESSQTEKKTCAAIHAVNLRNFLGMFGKVEREEQKSESANFLNLFKMNNITVQFLVGEGTKTSLNSVSKSSALPQVFFLVESSNRKYFHFIKRPHITDHIDYLVADEINFILCNQVFYILASNKYSAMKLNRARLFIDKMRKMEKSNDKKLKLRTITFSFESKNDENGCFLRDAHFFENKEEKETIANIFDSIKVNTFLSDGSILRREKSREFIEHNIKNFPVVYLLKMTKKTIEFYQKKEALKMNNYKKIFQDNTIFIVDCNLDLFLWIGRKNSFLAKQLSQVVIKRYCKLANRKESLIKLHQEKQGSESFIFKSKFPGWIEESTLTSHFDVTVKKAHEIRVSEKSTPKNASATKPPNERKLLTHADFNLPKIDVEPIFFPKEEYTRPEQCLQLVKFSTENLAGITGFAFENKNFVKMDNEEIGHFYSHNCYVILANFYEYDTETQKYKYRHIVYFWEGKHCAKTGWLQFSFTLRKQLEEGFNTSLKVERIKQQQEPPKFLCLFYQNVIFHRGERPEINQIQIKYSEVENDHEKLVRKQEIMSEIYNSKKEKLQFYQVRSTAEILTCRCIQIDVDSSFMSTEFNHILIQHKNSFNETGLIYVWLGKKSCLHDKESSKIFAKKMVADLGYEMITMNEGEENVTFWQLLDNKKDYLQTAEIRKCSRLFRCTNETGHFSIRERCADFCNEDLKFDDVMMLDSGTEVFLWIGDSANSSEIAISNKIAPVYLEHLRKTNQTNRKLITVKMGHEPVEFRRVFHGFETS